MLSLLCSRPRLWNLEYENRKYTQFAIQDSCLFGPNPWKVLAPPSNYLSKKSFWATQPLEQILDSKFLLCELGVREWPYGALVSPAPVKTAARFFFFFFFFFFCFFLFVIIIMFIIIISSSSRSSSSSSSSSLISFIVTTTSFSSGASRVSWVLPLFGRRD